MLALPQSMEFGGACGRFRSYFARESSFLKKDFLPYHNKRGGRIKTNKQFPLKESYTFKFAQPKSYAQMESKNIVDEDDLTSILEALDNLVLIDE